MSETTEETLTVTEDETQSVTSEPDNFRPLSANLTCMAHVGGEKTEMDMAAKCTDLTFFQPLQEEQIILPDVANCLAVHAFLRMCGLKFDIEMRSNAEFMSPSGRVPFIKCGPFIVSELDPIVAFFRTKDISLSDSLTSDQRKEMRTYMTLVNGVLGSAELYLSWCVGNIRRRVTFPRYGSPYPFPLNMLVCCKKDRDVRKFLQSTNWASKSTTEVYRQIEIALRTLSRFLQNRNFFFGKVTELDALVFGHVSALATTPLSDTRIAEMVGEYPNLNDFCQKIRTNYLA